MYDPNNAICLVMCTVGRMYKCIRKVKYVEHEKLPEMVIMESSSDMRRRRSRRIGDPRSCCSSPPLSLVGRPTLTGFQFQ